MAAIRCRDTKPETQLRSALHRLGYRFRKDYPIRLGGKLLRPDIVFTKGKVAVFVDGCFWHCCPEHGQQPRNNVDYWSPKLRSNVERDRLQTELLEEAGWHVTRIWAHEVLDSAVAIVRRSLPGNSSIRQ